MLTSSYSTNRDKKNDIIGSEKEEEAFKYVYFFIALGDLNVKMVIKTCLDSIQQSYSF